MINRSRFAFAILIAAAVLGLLGDQLLRVGPWGLNASIWIAMLTIILARFFLAFDPDSPKRHFWIFGMVAGFGALLMWHDSTFLKLLDILAIGLSIALLPVVARRQPLQTLTLIRYIFELGAAGVSAVVGTPLLLFKDVQWRDFHTSERSTRVIGIIRGIAIAVPLLILFGGLFVAADATFEGIVKNIFDIDLVEIIGHLSLMVFWFWFAAGIIRRVFLDSEIRLESFALSGRPSIGAMETGLALGLLNLLFLSFVLVQLQYLFGGAALVNAARDLTLAQYARRGFFELVTVAALAVPLLLGAHWLLRKEKLSDERMFRWLAGSLMALLFVIMASAAQRLLLYAAQFGITEQRVYAFVFMAWLAVALIWFSLTVLRGRRDRFTFGALLTGLAAILILNVMDPEALIVRVNSGRAAEGNRFDAAYLTSLSLDAAPELIAALPSYSENDRSIIASRLLQQYQRRSGGDWRTWSLAKSSALRLISENQENLQRMVIKKPN
ncbi:MAG TPA: DUF4173 domain-containing protein [Bacteroidota bacterium]|nr:DUF4173 domain-containing protein [Bacteroidota bacterium]